MFKVKCKYVNICKICKKCKYIKLKWDCPTIMNDVLTLNQNTSYNLRSDVTVTRRNIKTNKFGFEIISTIGAVLWQNLPNNIKNSDSLNIFQHKIKQWTPINVYVRFAELSKRTWKRHMYALFPFLLSVLCSFSLFYPRVFTGLR